MNDLPSGAEILRTFDAHVKATPGLAEDQKAMTTWFADAIMRGYDAAKRQDHLPPPAETTPGLPAGLYRHYKGGIYLLLGIAQHSEHDDELIAVYVSLDASRPGPRLRARPLYGPQGWLTAVGESQEPRYTYIGLDGTANNV